MASEPRIAVLMTCHNRRETTLRCLWSLRGQVKGSGEDGDGRLDVFLVDDGSTDGTGAAVRDWYEAEVQKDREGLRMGLHLIAGDGHLFWAKGMACAWQSSIDCERQLHSTPFAYFLWLNDDVVLKPDALRNLIADSRGIPERVVIGACSTDAGERESSYSATDLRDAQLFPNGAPQPAEGWFNGNCVLIPRSAYEKAGMIDGAYSHARADYDYAERLKRAGVPFCCSSHFAGVCEKDWAHKPRPKTLPGRLALLFRPGYFNLADMWRYRVRYYGIARAVVSCVHLVINQFKGPA